MQCWEEGSGPSAPLPHEQYRQNFESSNLESQHNLHVAQSFFRFLRSVFLQVRSRASTSCIPWGICQTHTFRIQQSDCSPKDSHGLLLGGILPGPHPGKACFRQCRVGSGNGCCFMCPDDSGYQPGVGTTIEFCILAP